MQIMRKVQRDVGSCFGEVQRIEIGRARMAEGGRVSIRVKGGGGRMDERN